MLENEVRIVKIYSGTEYTKGRKYTALTHCWGTGVNLKLISSNYEALTKLINVSELPLNFQTSYFSHSESWDSLHLDRLSLYLARFLRGLDCRDR